MAAAIFIEIIAIASNISVTADYYLPICTGAQTSGNTMSVAGGRAVILGYNHLGKGPSVLTIDTTTTSAPDNHHDTALPTTALPTTTLQTTQNLFSKRTTRDIADKRKEENSPIRRPKKVRALPKKTSPHSAKPSSITTTIIIIIKITIIIIIIIIKITIIVIIIIITSSSSSSSSPRTDSETKNLDGQRKPSHKNTASPTSEGAFPTKRSPLLQTRSRSRTIIPNFHSHVQMSQIEANIAGKRGGLTTSDVSHDNLSIQSIINGLRPLARRARRTSNTEASIGSSSCSCEINADSEFTVRVEHCLLPESVEHDTAVWITAGNVSERLPLSQKGMQFHVHTNNSQRGKAHYRDDKKKAAIEESSAGVGENTTNDAIRANLFITTSDKTPSFILALTVTSPGDINVSCSSQAHNTESGDRLTGRGTENSDERVLTGDIGAQSVAGEQIAGIILIVLAVLIITAVCLWARYYRTPRWKRRKRQAERERESFPMKTLSNYEEMENAEMGYYRYSDPLDHRTTLTTTSQLALDKAHIVLHHPELASASVGPKNSGGGAPRATKPETPSSSIPGPSRHLAELAVMKPRADADDVSDVYEEYSSVMVHDEEEEQQQQRAEALRKVVAETQRSVDKQLDQTDATPQRDRVAAPVVIRVHRKESDNKKPDISLVKNPPLPDLSLVGDDNVYANSKDLNVQWDPLMSDHPRNASDEYTVLAGSLDKARVEEKQSETPEPKLDKLVPEHEDSTEYMNTRDLLTTKDSGTRNFMSPKPINHANNEIDYEITSVDASGQYSIDNAGNRVCDTSIPIQPQVKQDTGDEYVGIDPRSSILNSQFDLESSNQPSEKLSLKEQIVSNNDPDLLTYGLSRSKPLFYEKTWTDNDPDLETYGLGSAKPLVNVKSKSENHPGIETYGSTSAKPLGEERSEYMRESETETYGLSSAKPLKDEKPWTDEDPDFETYGLGSAKPLVGVKSISKNDPSLETYGLASAKPLAMEQSKLNYSGIETYSLTSTGLLGQEKSEPISETGLETYGLSSGSPLGNKQPILTSDPGLETYGFASAKSLDHGHLDDIDGLGSNTSAVGLTKSAIESDLSYSGYRNLPNSASSTVKAATTHSAAQQINPGSESLDSDSAYSHLHHKSNKERNIQLEPKTEDNFGGNLPVQVISVGQFSKNKNNSQDDGSSMEKIVTIHATNKPLPANTTEDIYEKAGNKDVCLETSVTMVSSDQALHSKDFSQASLNGFSASEWAPGSVTAEPSRPSAHETKEEEDNVYGNLSTLHALHASHDSIEEAVYEDDIQPLSTVARDNTDTKDDGELDSGNVYESYSQLTNENTGKFRPQVDSENKSTGNVSPSGSTTLRSTGLPSANPQIPFGGHGRTDVVTSSVYTDLEENC
ncbi:LOW QUALITY PROTEIN: ovarian abundant message protein [Elysia marginata]|uniref:Ovarian abundant message protein n=1 Tax=Elysia marginata TaxID=1093978 RepID=A0AAV4ITR6_9GAST|nr:LOW QUALITY PROTEIN: ovarian abundant message protein [Elysia marginata]